jgi:hypothetical protein
VLVGALRLMRSLFLRFLSLARYSHAFSPVACLSHEGVSRG